MPAEEVPPPPPHVLNATTLPLLQRCETCKQTVPGDCPVVYADRAGYSRQWHPACFVCCRCSEPLVDLIYFWKSGAAWCGRHYCESLRPRCAGCDEVGTGRRPPARRSPPALRCWQGLIQGFSGLCLTLLARPRCSLGIASFGCWAPRLLWGAGGA